MKLIRELISLITLLLALAVAAKTNPPLQCDLLDSINVVDAALKITTGELYVFSNNYVSKLKRIEANSMPEIAEGFPMTIQELWPSFGDISNLSAAFEFEDNSYFILVSSRTL